MGPARLPGRAFRLWLGLTKEPSRIQTDLVIFALPLHKHLVRCGGRASVLEVLGGGGIGAATGEGEKYENRGSHTGQCFVSI